MGHGVNGGFARYVVARPDQLYRVPANFPLEEAAISEPFAAAIQAVTELTHVRIGDTALVSGPGPMGLLCLKLLVAEGVKVIVAGLRATMPVWMLHCGSAQPRLWERSFNKAE